MPEGDTIFRTAQLGRALTGKRSSASARHSTPYAIQRRHTLLAESIKSKRRQMRAHSFFGGWNPHLALLMKALAHLPPGRTLQARAFTCAS